MALTRVHNRLIEGAAVNVKDFGAVGDGVTDDTSAIQNAVNHGATRVFVPSGTYVISSTIEVPIGTYIFGESSLSDSIGSPSKLIPSASSTSYYEADGSQTANGYLFFMNVDPANPGTWINQYPNIGSGGISHLLIDGTNGAGGNGIKGAYFSGGYEFKDIRNNKVTTLLRATDGEYQDHITIKRIFSSQRANDTDFLIYLSCLGDALIIDDVASGFTGNETGITKCIYLGSFTGGKVSNLINGIIQTLSTNIEFTHLSLFGGYMIIDGGDVTITKSSFSINEDYEPPITVQATNGSFSFRYSISITDCRFNKTVNDSQGVFWTSTEVPDIDVTSPHISVNIGRGNKRAVVESGNLAESQVMGILVRNSSSSMTDWEYYSHFLSEQGTVVQAARTDISGHTPNFNQNFNGFSASSTETFSGAEFQAATDTYYYGIQFIIDPVRLLGRTAASTAEVNIAATNGSANLPSLVVDYGSITRVGNHIIRIYRGTSTGSYDKYIDIPVINVKKFIDNGDGINGFAWKSRTAGAMDTLCNNGWSGPATWNDNLIEIFGTAGGPNQGTWKQGDVAKRTNTTIDGNNMNLFGYKRLTDGSGQVSGTDWATMQISHVSPAT